jgi:hypothetical protein
MRLLEMNKNEKLLFIFFNIFKEIFPKVSSKDNKEHMWIG